MRTIPVLPMLTSLHLPPYVAALQTCRSSAPENTVDLVHSGMFVAVVIEGDMGAAKSFCKAFHKPISLIPTFTTTRNDSTASFSSLLALTLLLQGKKT